MSAEDALFRVMETTADKLLGSNAASGEHVDVQAIADQVLRQLETTLDLRRHSTAVHLRIALALEERLRRYSDATSPPRAESEERRGAESESMTAPKMDQVLRSLRASIESAEAALAEVAGQRVIVRALAHLWAAYDELEFASQDSGRSAATSAGAPLFDRGGGEDKFSRHR